MGYGAIAIFSDSIASGASTSGGTDLGGRNWDKISVQIPTMSTATVITLQNSVDGGTTWYDVFHPTIQSATVATPQFYISAAVGAGGGLVPIPEQAFSKLRFLTTAVVSGGVAFKVICGG